MWGASGTSDDISQGVVRGTKGTAGMVIHTKWHCDDLLRPKFDRFISVRRRNVALGEGEIVSSMTALKKRRRALRMGAMILLLEARGMS